MQAIYQCNSEYPIFWHIYTLDHLSTLWSQSILLHSHTKHNLWIEGMETGASSLSGGIQPAVWLFHSFRDYSRIGKKIKRKGTGERKCGWEKGRGSTSESSLHEHLPRISFQDLLLLFSSLEAGSHFHLLSLLFTSSGACLSPEYEGAWFIVLPVRCCIIDNFDLLLAVYH